jgi:carboxylate-amine ligase
MTDDGTTLGVEEEFLLLDPATGRPADQAEAVLAAAGRAPLPGTELHRELLASQVEAASGVCHALPDLGRRLEAARARLATAAAESGLLLISAGTPPRPAEKPHVTETGRFSEIAEIYALVAADYEVCGCHVHVGIADRDTAVAVINHLRPWLPSLLALSANSPYARGRNSGYASWRMVEQARFPGSGVPPSFADAAAYDAAVDRLVDCGVLVDPAMSFWLVRPSPHLPTLEFRVADAVPTAREALLQAALSRALVRTALAEVRAGRAAPVLDDQICRAAVWSAARHGLAGPAVDPFAGRTIPAPALVAQMVAWVRPALEECGDLQAVRKTLDLLVRQGTGAQRQLAAADPVAEVLVREGARHD